MTCFYPRHPRGWRRRVTQMPSTRSVFLSTPPSRVATRYINVTAEFLCLFLSTPPSRVATVNAVNGVLAVHKFLSTPPSRVATFIQQNARVLYSFLSTPPSRVATHIQAVPSGRVQCFYPRHPRGWRQVRATLLRRQVKFLSTPPSRVATSLMG